MELPTLPTASSSTAASHASLNTLVALREQEPDDGKASSVHDKDALYTHSPITEEPSPPLPKAITPHRTPRYIPYPPPNPNDLAPVDLPPVFRHLDDHNGFAELARHLSAGPPPDGGREAWGVVAGAWLILFVEFGMLTSFGQFQSYYQQNQLSHLSPSTVSWIPSLAIFLTFFLSIFGGRAFDAYGIKHLVVVGTILAVGSLVAIAFCKEFYQFLLAHALFGIAGALLYSPSTALLAHWFLNNRPTAIGIILSGSGLGGVIFPILLSNLFTKLGFRNAVLVAAGVAAVMFAPSWWLMKTRLEPRKAVPWRHAGRPWREGRYTVFVLGVALVWMNYFSPFFYANDFAISQGLTPELAEYGVAILNAGSFFGRILSGPLANLLGALETFILSGVLSAVTLLALWSTRSVGVPGTIIGLFLYGLFSGAVIALVAACCAQLSPVREFGLRLGMLWSVASLPLLAGPQIAGVLIEKEGGYTGFAVWSGVTIAVGSVGAFGPVIWGRVGERMGWEKKEVVVEGSAEKGNEGEAVKAQS